MAKQKRKIGKNRKPIKNRNGGIPASIKILSVLIVLLFILSAFIPSSKKHVNPKINFSSKSVSNLTDIKKEKISSTPTPTPTPVPLTGYCLTIPVLMYHHIQPYEVAKTLGQTALTVDSAAFDSQMQYLSQNGYTTLFANDFINALINKSGLPDKSVVITIDDGYEDNYIYALPILQKYGLRANIMLASGLMGNSNMLSWDEVINLKSSGLIYFTNHTWSHYPINQGPQDKIEYELDTAKNEIEQNTGQSVNVFTYPYGAISDNAIATLNKKGYIGAFSEIPGNIQCDSFLQTLHRTRIGNSTLPSYGI